MCGDATSKHIALTKYTRKPLLGLKLGVEPCSHANGRNCLSCLPNTNLVKNESSPPLN